jgi:hypothetical protein
VGIDIQGLLGERSGYVITVGRGARPRLPESHRRVERRAHRRHRARLARHQLHLGHGLVQQHLQPAPHARSRGERGGGERGGPRRVDHVEHHRARAGRDERIRAAGWQRRDDDVGADELRGRRRRVGQRGDDPRGDAEALRGVAQLGGAGEVAHQHRDVVDPRLAQRSEGRLRGAARAEHDRAPRHVTERGADADDVGVVGGAPSREHEGVGRADRRGQLIHLVGDVERDPLERHGQRQARPLRAEAVDEPG